METGWLVVVGPQRDESAIEKKDREKSAPWNAERNIKKLTKS